MPAPAAATLQHRISEQLQALSQVGEHLTLRLLDLEERLNLIETKLSDLIRGADADSTGADTGELLALTEERLARLETLLEEQRGDRGEGGRMSYPHLSSLPSMRESSPTPVEELDPDPFPEDGEQPFMDELSA